MARSSTSGQGRPKGAVNKITGELKAMVLQALEQEGGVDYLRWASREQPASFLTLLGKILPMQVTGSDGNAVTIQVVTGIARSHEPGEG